VIVNEDADLDLALQAVLFAAVGTAYVPTFEKFEQQLTVCSGQRCTSTRRLLLHRSIADEFLSKLLSYYNSSTPSSTLRAGDPLESATLIGPLHTTGAVGLYERTIQGITSRGGQVLCERQGRMDAPFSKGKEGNWVWPVVVRPKEDDVCWREETFAPILYVREFDALDEAIA
jgi:aldehyde dehydrogenase family 7 protein A1